MLSLGLFRPQLVLPFVLVAFLAGKWKFVRGFIPGAVLVVALVDLGGRFPRDGRVRSNSDFAGNGRISRGAERTMVRAARLDADLARIVVDAASLFAGKIGNVLLLSGTFGALLLAAKRMRSSKDGETFDIAFAWPWRCITVVSFHSFVHDFSLMVLPILIAGDAVASAVR